MAWPTQNMHYHYFYLCFQRHLRYFWPHFAFLYTLSNKTKQEQHPQVTWGHVANSKEFTKSDLYDKLWTGKVSQGAGLVILSL